MRTLSVRQAGETAFLAMVLTICVALAFDVVLSFAKRDVPLIGNVIMAASLYFLFFWLFVPERGNAE